MGTNRWMVWAMLFGGSALLGGCATARVPTERMEATSSSIRAAEEVGADRLPQASLHLQLAREQSEHAKQLAAKGDVERATRLLARADADAELAVALARTADEKAQADQELQKIKTLERQNR